MRRTILNLLTLVLLGFSSVYAQRTKDIIAITNSDKLYSAFPKTFLSDILRRDKIAPDGKYLAGITEGDVYILDLSGKEPVRVGKNAGMDWIDDFDWISGHELMLKGLAGGQHKNVVYEISSGKPEAGSGTDITGSSSAGVYAYKFFDEKANTGGVYIRRNGKDPATLVLPGIYPASLCLSPDSKSLAYLYLKNPDNLCLGIYDIDSAKSRDLATGLDGSLRSEIAFDPESKHVLVSLVTDKLDNIRKHQPAADRDLDIYAVHIRTGAIIPVLIEEGDDIFVGVSGNKLIWDKVLPNVRTCLVPMNGNKVVPLIPGFSFLPSWNNTGDQLAVVYGEWRIADIPLDWNIGTFGIDTGGKVTQGIKPVAAGMNEEYGPAISPDGKSILYSARLNTSPYPTTGDQLTEDLFMQKTGSATARKLTGQFQEISDIDWAPDNHSAVVSAMNKGDTVYQAFLVTIPSDTSKMGEVQLITPSSMKDNVLSVSWSPDGKRIAAETGDGTVNRSLWTFSPDGNNAKKLLEYEGLTFNSGLDFTPDGKSIVYSAFDGNHHQLYKLDAVGGKPVKITDNSYDLLFPQVSPQGDRIAVTLFRHTRQVWMADISYE